ncbi:MAG: S8 family serine peptidase [Tannerella sp.]|jgi:subtilisin family serine protease|nr:S8 family serine peptidase [Tannerella sp.]
MKDRTVSRLLRAGVLLLFAGTVAAGESYCFRVYLKDKGVTDASLLTPETFLSKESLDRRVRRMVDVSLSDVPIAPSHVETLVAAGVRPVTQSKWMATVVVESDDSLAVDRLKVLPVVDSVQFVWKGADRLTGSDCPPDTTPLDPTKEKTSQDYGYAQTQIEMLNGIKLHELGKRGQGMRIAVIDAGFLNVDRISMFESLHLLGTHNVVFPGGNVYCEDDHGTKVLSCLAANQPGRMVGTAPDASYLLIKSEDTRSEYPIEEDFWAAALEYADSMGIDIVSSSLGYYVFDTNDTLYHACDLDGKTAFISQVARMAEEKGILLFVSAGNEGNHEWGKITFPADVPGLLTVGAINEGRRRSSFSSTGFTADYRVKPDIVALGTGATVVDASGDISRSNGTSFSTPIVAGLGACLWQALSWLSNREIMALIRQTASQADHPDAEQGYGIPDMYKAYQKELNAAVQ